MSNSLPLLIFELFRSHLLSLERVLSYMAARNELVSSAPLTRKVHRPFAEIFSIVEPSEASAKGSASLSGLPYGLARSGDNNRSKISKISIAGESILIVLEYFSSLTLLAPNRLLWVCKEFGSSNMVLKTVSVEELESRNLLKGSIAPGDAIEPASVAFDQIPSKFGCCPRSKFLYCGFINGSVVCLDMTASKYGGSRWPIKWSSDVFIGSKKAIRWVAASNTYVAVAAVDPQNNLDFVVAFLDAATGEVVSWTPDRRSSSSNLFAISEDVFLFVLRMRLCLIDAKTGEEIASAKLPYTGVHGKFYISLRWNILVVFDETLMEQTVYALSVWRITKDSITEIHSRKIDTVNLLLTNDFMTNNLDFVFFARIKNIDEDCIAAKGLTFSPPSRAGSASSAWTSTTTSTSEPVPNRTVSSTKCSIS